MNTEQDAMTYIKGQFQSLHANVNEQYDSLSKRVSELDAVVLDVAQKSGGGFVPSIKRGNGIHRQLGTLEAWKGFVGGQRTTGRMALDWSVKSEPLTSLQGSPDTDPAGVSVQNQRIPGMWNWAMRPLGLLDVLPVMPCTSNAVTYTRLTSAYVNAAAPQPGEGELKAEAHTPVTLISAPIVTFAHIHRVSRQVLDDEPLLLQSLDLLLRFGVRDRIERDLINGAGGQFQIDGLLNQATAITPTATALADAISEAIAEMGAAGYVTTALVMSPRTWHAIRSERDLEDGYVANGWATPTPPSIWGVPVVATAGIGDTDLLLLDTAKLAYLERQNVTLEGFEQDVDNVSRNLVTLRAEARGGLMVGDEGAVRSIEIGSALS